MPYCDHCNKEYYNQTLERCLECGRPLLPQKPTWRPYDPEEPLVAVRTVYSEPQAYLIKGFLQQEGIPALIQYEAAGRVLGLTVDGMGANRIMVPESLAAAAEEVLAAFEEGTPIEQEPGETDGEDG